MPLDIVKYGILEGFENVPYWEEVKTYTPYLIVASLIKLYTNGSANTWERKLHGKVYIVTGGTSGVGAALVRDLATRGAQLVLLTSQLSEDSDASGKTWISDYIDDLRETTNNQMIYAEDCDLSSLYSIRKFATKWLDNSPARRLDGVICLAGECLPIKTLRTNTIDGVERQIAINYLSHYHLLTLLEPALRVQPPDRDVRVIVSSCLSQALGSVDVEDLLWEEKVYPKNKPWKVYGTSKLLLNMFAKEFQRKVESIPRADKQPCGIRVNIVNPGIIRSPSTRRFISMGTLIGLLFYILLYPIFWLFLKSCEQGMQSYLFAINSPNMQTMNGGNYIKECDVLVNESRSELRDAELQKQVYEVTAKKIEDLEKRSAIKRNKGKKKKDAESSEKTDSKTKATKKKTGKTDKPITTAKSKENIGVFESAFKNEPGLYPDMSKMGQNMTGDIEAGREARLRRLDAKYDQSRTPKESEKDQTSNSIETINNDENDATVMSTSTSSSNSKSTNNAKSDKGTKSRKSRKT